MELTDTFDVDIKCLDGDHWNKAVINSESDYKNLYEHSDQKLTNYPLANIDCSKYIVTGLDFTNKTILGVYITKGLDTAKSKIYISEKEKKYLCLTTIDGQNMALWSDKYKRFIVIPKMKYNYTVSFDTKYVLKGN